MSEAIPRGVPEAGFRERCLKANRSELAVVTLLRYQWNLNAEWVVKKVAPTFEERHAYRDRGDIWLFDYEAYVSVKQQRGDEYTFRSKEEWPARKVPDIGFSKQYEWKRLPRPVMHFCVNKPCTGALFINTVHAWQHAKPITRPMSKGGGTEKHWAVPLEHWEYVDLETPCPF